MNETVEAIREKVFRAKAGNQGSDLTLLLSHGDCRELASYGRQYEWQYRLGALPTFLGATVVRSDDLPDGDFRVVLDAKEVR